MTGKIMLTEPMVFYVGRRGRLIARQLARQYRVEYTEKQMSVRRNFTMYNNIWPAVPDKVAELWEFDARAQGSAHLIEKNKTVSYGHMPISAYPRRPKLMVGRQSFVGSNMILYARKMSTPRFIPPNIPEYIPPSPSIELTDYNRERGEATIDISIPDLTKRKEIKEKKACLWINIYSGGKHLRCYHLATFDIPDEGNIIYKFSSFLASNKSFGHKEIFLKDLPYIFMDIAGEIAVARAPEFAAVVSAASNILTPVLLNDQRYIDLHKMIKEGKPVPIEMLEFGPAYDGLMKKFEKGFYIVGE